jgi:hypothetical protein
MQPVVTFGSDKALTTLLTTESLLFAVFALTLSFGGNSLSSVVVVDVARKMALAVAAVLTILGIGAATAWVATFLGTDPSPHGFNEWCPAAAIAVGVVAQPIFAWFFVASLRRR